MNQSESLADFMQTLACIQSHARAGVSLVNDGAIKAITHCQTFGDASPVIKLTEQLDQTGLVKGATKAFKYLAYHHTGAKSDGTIDAKRQNSGKDTYLAALDQVKELGLVPWYESVTGTGKPELTDEEKAAKKAKKAETQALNWLSEQAKQGGLTGAKCKAMLEYGAAYEKLYDANPDQARSQLQGDLNHIAKQLATVALQVVNG